VYINNCHFWINFAIAGGGVEIAICNSHHSEIEYENVTFSDNSASEEGGEALNMLRNEEIKSDNHDILNNVQFFEKLCTLWRWNCYSSKHQN